RIIEHDRISQRGRGGVVEERTQVGDVEKLTDAELARPAGADAHRAGLAGKIVHCNRVDGLVYHARVEGGVDADLLAQNGHRRLGENRPAVALRAFGGAEKGTTASLLRGGDRGPV